MQEMIRGKRKDQFEMVDKFVALKVHNQLRHPNDVADEIVDFMEKGEYVSGEIYDLRDL